MKKRCAVIVVAIFMLLGFGTLSFGQTPDISGQWLFDLSGTLQGGALITVTATADPNCEGYVFDGYGVGLEGGGKDGNAVLLSGCLAVDDKGKITGTYETTDLFEETALGEGDLTGKVDKKVTKLSLKFDQGLNGKAIKLPSDPSMPSSWTATTNGNKAAFDLTIAASADFPHRMYTITGDGVVHEQEGDLAVSLTGGFFLNPKSVAYGWYEAYDESDALMESGLFFGKVKLTPGKSSFSFKLTGYDSEDDSMSKSVLKGTANDS